MKVKEIMTKSPTFCTPDSCLQAAARMMCDGDCGAIPVLDGAETMSPVGVITDRDIACRAIATGKSLHETRVADSMTSAVISVTPEAGIEECCKLIERHRVRRILVVDAKGRCVGIVSLSDIARKCGARKAGELLCQMSEVPV